MKKSTTREIDKRSKAAGRAVWFFILPGLIVYLVLGWLPRIAMFPLIFQKYNVVRGGVYVGLENFSYLNNPITWIAFRNTFYYAALSIGLTFIVPILIAILLMEMRRSIIRVMMILWFIPTASMAGILIWKWFYNVQYGLFNGILTFLGLPTLGWLNDPRLAMFCIVLPGLIMYGPGLVYIAALQGIPEELYEAAELEGAHFWQKIWKITLPRLRPIIAVMLILSVIGSLQIFDSPRVMTEGGPKMLTYTVVMYIYDIAFKNLKFGRSSTLSVILFFVIITLVIIQRKCFKENIDV